MGLYHSLYVGAYLELVKVPTKTRKSYHKKCPQCGTSGRGFCQECGTKCEHFEEEYTPDYSELIGNEYQDVFSLVYRSECEELQNDILVENGGFFYKPMSHPTEIPSGTSEFHIQNFKESYKEIIDKLSAAGVESVVKFGAISYWS